MYDRKANNEYYKHRGICVRCHSREAEPGKVLCWICAEQDAERYQRITDEQRKIRQEADRLRKRKQAEERLAKGLCPRCGKRQSINNGLCAWCRGYQQRYREKRRRDNCIIPRSELKSYGLCYNCGGKNPVMPGTGVCQECYEKRMATLPAMMDGLRKYIDEGENYWRKQNRQIFSKKERNLNLTKDED